jgi:hypothetical protein
LLLLQGHAAAAFALHPLVLPLAPLYFGALGALLVDYIRGPSNAAVKRASWIQRPWVTAAAVVLLVATVGLWAVRFGGFLGGPVPVESYRSWAAERALR